MLNLCDTSHWQSSVDCQALHDAGVVGLINKASQGLTYEDDTYWMRRQQAVSAGLLFGGYHFLNPGSGAAQADYYLSCAKPDGVTLLCLDYESGTVFDAEQFVSRLHDVTGTYPLLYTRASLIVQQIQNKPTLLSQCPLWIASYVNKPVLPPQWSTWALWQHSDGVYGPEPHSATGVGIGDMDWFDGTLDQLKALWQSLSPTTPPAPKADIRSVTADLLNIRSGPGTTYARLGMLSRGTKIRVASSAGGWASYIMPQGAVGWLAVQYLTPVG